ncbi:hypothetical protein QQX98_001142 [Neonectria punicea]|uniref:F-box domain-containing protein n=1 Tax=Neonectria punicea TaxID=979145 RepID=A0ABR1HQT2_9HYPO
MADAGSGTTSRLHTIPDEIAANIASFLVGQELDGVTRVSRLCRQRFGPRMYRRLEFRGREYKLAKALRAFSGFSQSSQGIDLRHSTRYLTIRLEQPLPQIPKLESLVLDLEFLREGPLRAYSDHGFWDKVVTKKWPVSELRVAAPQDFIQPIITYGKLQALQVFNTPNGQWYSHAALHQPELKRLHVTVEMGADFSSMRVGLLNKINADFEQLQSLTIEEKPATTNLMIIDYSRPQFESLIQEFIRALQSFTNLKRFAFTIWKARLGQKLVGQEHRRGRPPPGLSFQEDVEQLMDLAARIGEALPKLEQLCIILDYPLFIRCTRNREGAPVTVNLIRCAATKPVNGFPFDVLE